MDKNDGTYYTNASALTKSLFPRIGGAPRMIDSKEQRKDKDITLHQVSVGNRKGRGQKKKDDTEVYIRYALVSTVDNPPMTSLHWQQRGLMDAIYTIIRAVEDRLKMRDWDFSIAPPPVEIAYADIRRVLRLKEGMYKKEEDIFGDMEDTGQSISDRMITDLLETLIGTLISVNTKDQAAAWDDSLPIKTTYTSNLISGGTIKREKYRVSENVERYKRSIIIPPKQDPETKKYSYIAAMPTYQYAQDIGYQIRQVSQDWFVLPGKRRTERKGKINEALFRILSTAQAQGKATTKNMLDSLLFSIFGSGAKEMDKRTVAKLRDAITAQLQTWVGVGVIRRAEYYPAGGYNNAYWIITLGDRQKKLV